MKKKHLVGLTIFFSLCLITFACRKEIEYFVHGREKAPSMLVESAKMWHLRNLTTRDPNSRLIPRWNDAWVMNTSKGTRVVVPAPERHINNNNINIRRFVILKVSGNSITDGQIVEFLGEKYNVSGNIDLLLEKYESGKIPDFTGAVMQYDINYYPVSSTSYTNGVKDNRIATLLNSEQKKLRSKTKEELLKMAALRYRTTKSGMKIASATWCSDPIITYHYVPDGIEGDCTITFYVISYWNSDGCLIRQDWDYMSHYCTGGSGNGSGSGSGSAGGSGSGSGGWDYGGPPYGGGGSTGNVPSPVITNEIQDPCLSAFVNDLITKDIKYNINYSLNSIFNVNDNINLKFKDDPTMSPSLDGTTSTVGGYAGGQKMLDIEITLNGSTLPGSAREYIAATVIHEALHGYFRFVNMQSSLDHEMMAVQYIQYFSQILKQMYPSISNADAENLGWGGLGETASWARLSEAQKAVIIAANNAYKQGKLGEKCN